MPAIGQQRVLGQLEGENTKEKVEVILRHTGEGSPALELRSLRWGPGVGWYVQKTIVLGPMQVRRLGRLLCRTRMKGAKKTAGQKIVPIWSAVRR